VDTPLGLLCVCTVLIIPILFLLLSRSEKRLFLPSSRPIRKMRPRRCFSTGPEASLSPPSGLPPPPFYDRCPQVSAADFFHPLIEDMEFDSVEISLLARKVFGSIGNLHLLSGVSPHPHFFLLNLCTPFRGFFEVGLTAVPNREFSRAFWYPNLSYKALLSPTEFRRFVLFLVPPPPCSHE